MPSEKRTHDGAGANHDANGGTTTRHISLPSNPASSTDTAPSLEAGVRKVELIASSWGKQTIYIAYVGVFLMASAVSFGEQLNYQLLPFATSSFKLHSQVSSVNVVANVLLAVSQPPIAKLADVYGRTEGFFITLVIYCIGYIIAGTSTNVHTFTAAMVFQCIGVTGLKMLQQLFIIDTSSLRNRMLLCSIPDIPFMLVVWVAPLVTDRLKAVWGWGYGMWAIITPIASAPLVLSLFFQQRKLKKQYKSEYPDEIRAKPKDLSPTKVWKVLKTFWFKLDIGGLIILTAGMSCLLLPLSTPKPGWHGAAVITPIILGPLILIAFPFFETNRRLAPYPLLSKTVFTNPSVYLSCILIFFYFMAYFLCLQPYMLSYLLVTRNLSIQQAGYVMNTFNISCTVSILCAGWLCRHFSVYKPFLLAGCTAYTIAMGLMIHFRVSGVPTDKVGWIVFSQALVGVSAGFVNGPAQVGMQANLNHNEVAGCTAFWLTMMSLGGAVGSSISGAIWQWGIKHYLRRYLPAGKDDEYVEKIFGDVTVATALEWGGVDRTATVKAYEDTMKTMLIVAVCVCLPLLPCAWGMKSVDLGKKDRENEMEMERKMDKETRGLKGEDRKV